MDSLFERWKKKNTALSNQKKKSQNHTETQQNPNSDIEEIKTKQKKTKLKNQPKHQTPTKRKPIKQIIIDQFTEKLNKINATKGDKQTKIKQLLSQLWQVAQDNKQVQTSQIIKQSNIDTPSKLKNKMYNDLEVKYFQSEKQKHHLKGSIQSIKKKYENIEKQLERLTKIQRLVDATLKRQEILSLQNKQLKNEIQNYKERQVEQQKIFKKEVLVIHSLIQTIKSALPT